MTKPQSKSNVITFPKKKLSGQPRCGLCGKRVNLIQTDCCGNWICNDEHKYITFSYARNSCSRNHRRFTLCGYHNAEGHKGNWKVCTECRQSFKTEMYVWYGTNEYNFKMLENPPAYEPTKCSRCGITIKLGTDVYSQLGNQHWCEECSAIEMKKKKQEHKKKQTIKK
jgi:hypothetical protein